MKVIWSHRAISRLEEIQRYISQDSPLTAEKIIKKLVLASDRLRDFPRSGRVVPEYNRENIREIMMRPYRIIYVISDTRVEIVNVLHSRQLL